MKTFKLTYSSFKKWAYQNDAQIIETVEGCLLDNYLLGCKNGMAIAYETYKNCWNSVYTIKFERFHPNIQIFMEWYNFMDEEKGE